MKNIRKYFEDPVMVWGAFNLTLIVSGFIAGIIECGLWCMLMASPVFILGAYRVVLFMLIEVKRRGK